LLRPNQAFSSKKSDFGSSLFVQTHV
jgi:hypothetical protein